MMKNDMDFIRSVCRLRRRYIKGEENMLKDLLEKNRSYRGYDETRKVTEEELRELVACTRLCPATANVQPLKYSGMGAGGSKEDPAVDQMGWRIAAASSSGRGKMSVWIYCYLSGYQNQ